MLPICPTQNAKKKKPQTDDGYLRIVQTNGADQRVSRNKWRGREPQFQLE